MKSSLRWDWAGQSVLTNGKRLGTLSDLAISINNVVRVNDYIIRKGYLIPRIMRRCLSARERFMHGLCPETTNPLNLNTRM